MTASQVAKKKNRKTNQQCSHYQLLPCIRLNLPNSCVHVRRNVVIRIRDGKRQHTLSCMCASFKPDKGFLCNLCKINKFWLVYGRCTWICAWNYAQQCAVCKTTELYNTMPASVRECIRKEISTRSGVALIKLCCVLCHILHNSREMCCFSRCDVAIRT